ADDSAPESTLIPVREGVAQAPKPSQEPGELAQGAVVLVAPKPSAAPLAPINPFIAGERAVQAYIRSQLSPRSRDNARDALRRLSRLMLGDQGAEPSQFPWPAIGFEQATTIRTALFEMTRVGAITPGTANLTLSHLRGLIRTMYGMRLVTADQHELVHSGALKNVPGARKPRGRALSAGEERALREAARALEGYQGAMLDTAIVLAIGAGLRREEIARLSLDSLSPGQLRFIAKGNKEVHPPIDAQMQEGIDDWLKERALLAPTHRGLFCSPQKPDWVLSAWSFWSLVRTAAHHAFGDQAPCAKGCRCFKIVTGPHDFRRTFATRALDQGLDIREVQVLMGHESSETTARYDKRDEEVLFEKRRNIRILA
ncbi:hypothetical protein LCGC14_2618250, partial [marine sediment metagenome]